MRGDHDELEIFLEIRLIPSRIDQKLKNKGEIHGFLKGELAQKFQLFDPVVGTNLRRHGGTFTWRRRGFNSATIWTGFSGGFSLNFSSKAPRLGHDRASIMVLGLRRSSSAQVGEILWQKMCDRGSIGPRSWGSSTPCLHRPMALFR